MLLEQRTSALRMHCYSEKTEVKKCWFGEGRDGRMNSHLQGNQDCFAGDVEGSHCHSSFCNHLNTL